jgi:hypothetical protein
VEVIAIGAWGGVLHAKYRTFTTGTQFKENFLAWTLHAHPKPTQARYALFRDTSGEVDGYLVDDPMPPGSWQWRYSVSPSRVIAGIVVAEGKNLPRALKELTIVATPGVLLAFFLCIVILSRQRALYPIHWKLSIMAAVSAASLLAAYSMLVFDGRYLYPVLPLLLVIAARFLISDTAFQNHRGWRKISISLVIVGIAVPLLYRSSPFRAQKRDYEAISYRAGDLLRAHPPAKRLVSIGSGPLPEYGVGWEAGYLAAYFGGAKLIATLESLPSPNQDAALDADLKRAAPDAVVIWGHPDDRSYCGAATIAIAQLHHEQYKIFDPVLGEVGTLIF